MSTMQTPDPQRRDMGTTQTKMKATAGGSSLEAIGGIAAVILAILGLAHVAPVFLAAIAAIVVGAALIVEGGVMSSRLTRAATDAGVTGDVGGGLTAEFLGGAAGIVLGILAVLGASPVLVPVAVIVFGAALLIGSGANLELSSLGRQAAQPSVVIGGASGALVLVAIAAIVLGILALVGLVPTILSLVALLALGAAVLFTSTAMTARLVGFMGR